ncbi:sugar ABC transporter ATP-binding protein [Leucobacter weissii]|uniref:Sugar ABC transporter ATP-binding protein n=1 Tax=Leucobacter weissii TaxID=1983706 RepID=A0A939SAH9_9MICO|nr:sugar ABC transporter ATP-binding protein [Leucobacter weissii]MBO1900433.1 sugar ABC transporter ATP-binding protein [Leucobacter weissii]
MRSTDSASVRLEGVSKTFGANTVLDGIAFALRPGTVTGLVGENGAGKSTLIRILSGAIRPSSGAVEIDGRPLPNSTRGVIEAGVSVIYQELTDAPDMSLLENVLLGNLESRWGVKRTRENRRRALEGLRSVGLDHLGLDTPLSELTLAQRQLAEIARCLVRAAKVLVLDEPTSSLPEADVETLLGVVERLRDQGMTILYVTHHLDELFRISDRLIVLRDGRKVAEGPTEEWSEHTLVRAMLAGELEQAYPWRAREPGETILEAEGIEAPGVRGVDVIARSREIVGLVGLAGAGRTELMRALCGIAPVSSGVIAVDGSRVRPGSIRRSMRAGLLYASEDRKRDGLILDGTVEANLIYGAYREVSRLGVIDFRRVGAFAREVVSRYGVRLHATKQAIGELSGGNQQKIVVARVSEREPRVAFFDDPTRGVDVGAKSGIYEEIFQLAERGAAVFVSSSDTDEVLAVADRVYVLAAGRIVAELEREHFEREHILHLSSAAGVPAGGPNR